jgi:hypothetical protein
MNSGQARREAATASAAQAAASSVSLCSSWMKSFNSADVSQNRIKRGPR